MGGMIGEGMVCRGGVLNGVEPVEWGDRSEWCSTAGIFEATEEWKHDAHKVEVLWSKGGMVITGRF